MRARMIRFLYALLRRLHGRHCPRCGAAMLDDETWLVQFRHLCIRCVWARAEGGRR